MYRRGMSLVTLASEVHTQPNVVGVTLEELTKGEPRAKEDFISDFRLAYDRNVRIGNALFRRKHDSL
jgi:hypothetical protein